MTRKAPEYPGYKAPECNGCGACCLAVPCSVSLQFNLWRGGKCRALKYRAGRYWCQVLINPRLVSVQLAKIPRKDRVSAIGSGEGCDHRAAKTLEESLAVLRARSYQDELLDRKENTYPRGAVFHRDDGTTWEITIWKEDDPPMIRQIVDGDPVGMPARLEPNYG